LPAISARAATISVDLESLQSSLERAATEEDSVSRDILDRIAAAINESDLSFSEGELLYSTYDENITVEGGCNRSIIKSINIDLTLRSDTSLSLTLNSLYDPIVISTNIIASMASNGVARQIVGVRLGSCQNLARDSFDFEATGPAQITFSATLFLNPEWTDETTLTLFPKIELGGELLQFDPTVKVDDTILADVLEDYIRDELNDTFNNSRLSQELSSLQNKLDRSLSDALTNGQIDIELPPANDEQILALYQYLRPDARFPITLDMIRRHRQAILASILFGEPSSVNEIFADALLCESISAFMTPTNQAPVYSDESGSCEAVALAERTGNANWADSSCSVALNYIDTNLTDYCTVALDKTRLGNAASFPGELGVWTHSPGSRFDIGALSIKEKIQPFMQRVRYKTVSTAQGECELEMRLYSESADVSGKKPVIALHGGSWQHRASGHIGIESTATHFTNAGFVVFAPFYRLIGDSDGNVECQNANLDDLLSDVNDALDWVIRYSNENNLDGNVSLFGQSAGGHLALSIAANRPELIRRAMLFYTPTDFGDFAQQLKSGAYTNDAGRKILEAVSGQTLTGLDPNSELVRQNSFPEIISASNKTFPPMFILHGEMDALLPFRQSVRLCNALSGAANLNDGVVGLVPNLETLSRRIQCGNDGSELHLIAEGDHALDLCLAPGLCLSGSTESAEQVASSIDSMMRWAQADSVAVGVSGGGSSGGFGRLDWLLFSLLFVWMFFREFYSTRSNQRYCFDKGFNNNP